MGSPNVVHVIKSPVTGIAIMISPTPSGPITFVNTIPLANPNIFVMNAATVKIIVPLKRDCLVINYSPSTLSIYEYMHDKGKLMLVIIMERKGSLLPF